MKSTKKGKTNQVKVSVATKREVSTPQILFVIFAICVVTFISFLPVLKNSFINWDDNAYVFENIHLQKPFVEAVVYFFGPHFFIGNYTPLTMITYAVEKQIAGLDPSFFHGVNLVLHVLNICLVFVFIYLISKRKIVVAAFVSLLFGIHPMHVESVAWVAELKDVLYALFFLAGLIIYCYYLALKNVSLSINLNNFINTKKINPNLLLVVSFVLFLFSTLSKPAAIVFPLVLLSLDYYMGRKLDKWVWIEKVPFVVVSIVFGAITLYAQQADKLLHDYYPFYQRLIFACESVFIYIIKLFLPFRLSIFHPYPKLENGHFPYLLFLMPLLLGILIYGIYRSIKHTKIIVFGFLFFIINLLLVLQVVSFGDAMIAERYTYVSYIGLFYILGQGIEWIVNNSKNEIVKYKGYVIGVVAIFGLFCCYKTYARSLVWENDDTIATDLLEKYPEDRLALNNKGFILYVQKNYSESIKLLTQAIILKPDYTLAYINLINSYLAVKQLDSAAKYADMAYKNAPQDNNVLSTKGYIAAIKNNYSEALGYYKKAVEMKKDFINGYLSIAECYYQLHDNENWIKTINQGLSIDPTNYILLNVKGYSFFVQGKYSEAIEYYKSSLKMKPDFTVATNNLNACYKALADSAKSKR